MPNYSGNQGHSRVGSAKNLQGNGPGHHKLLNICTYNIKTWKTLAAMLVLLEKLSDIKWDVVGLSDVRRHGEEKKILKSSHAFC